ncbi:hypothetical protein OPT61_g4178 [Boeremia exigua]|uniref:Uncharacterized protein n=1 Tax=Boeremia exigua TaxID=749465 RepID=A0ACC2IF62_9PLEO|nr:hypothetical protein OPT61_g4178 [Boeremia exigua]
MLAELTLIINPDDIASKNQPLTGAGLAPASKTETSTLESVHIYEWSVPAADIARRLTEPVKELSKSDMLGRANLNRKPNGVPSQLALHDLRQVSFATTGTAAEAYLAKLRKCVDQVTSPPVDFAEFQKTDDVKMLHNMHSISVGSPISDNLVAVGGSLTQPSMFRLRVDVVSERDTSSQLINVDSQRLKRLIAGTHIYTHHMGVFS